MMQNLLYNIDYVRNVHWDRFDDYLFFTQTIPSYCQIICSVFMVGATGYFSRDRVEAVLKVVLTGFHLYFYVYRATLEGKFQNQMI